MNKKIYIIITIISIIALIGISSITPHPNYQKPSNHQPVHSEIIISETIDGNKMIIEEIHTYYE